LLSVRLGPSSSPSFDSLSVVGSAILTAHQNI
jgi:hypothetical protein